MAYYLVLSAGCFLIALIIRSRRFVFYSLAEKSVSLVNYLMSDLEEEAKVKLVQKGTNSLVLALLQTIFLGVISFGIGSIPIIIFCVITKTDYQSLSFSSLYPILSISIGATIPFLLPLKKTTESSYSELSQLLHRMVLNNYSIAHKLFRFETKKIRKRNLVQRQDFVIISGLARAGTTSLMNKLSEINDFISLNYANMPFLLSPNLWAKFYNPKSKDLKERSHKDGIFIGLNSNEALEEYFFKVEANDSYIHDSELVEYQLSKEAYNNYLNYQSIIKLDNSKIYLAKNNNFLLRYKSIREYNEEFLMVVLYRDPLTHAASLLEKHLDYLNLQEQDPFVMEYMNWLGHHEFGRNQKQFSFNDRSKYIEGDKTGLDYWLSIWINYYEYALSIEHPNTLFINYESFCSQPKETINKILLNRGIDSVQADYKAFVNTRKSRDDYSEDIYEKAQELFQKLCKINT